MARQPKKTGNSGGQDLLEDFKRICRRTGIRVTHQRLEIFQALVRSHGHPAAESIYAEVKIRVPTISLDTVYRTLNTLAQHGVLMKLQLDTRARFDTNLEPHHHFVCKECKGIVDFDWSELDEMKPPRNAARLGRIDLKYLELRGICNRCLEARNKLKR
jgi:Fur family peroxide stress response transcriptional regulator